MRADLNDRYLRSLKPPNAGRIEVSDTKRKGLRFRLSSKGKAVWMYEKRVKGGPKRKHTLGTWPAVSLADARATALELEAEANKGFDRIEAANLKRLSDVAARAGLSTVQMVIDIYDELHLSNLRTGAERKRQLEQSLSKHLQKSVSELTRKDLQEAVDLKAKAGRKIFANRIRAALVAFAKWAWERGYLDENIGSGVAKASKESARERVLSLSEVRQIWTASHDMGDLWGPMLRLLLLTGQRRGEIVKLRWSEIDFEKRQIVKPGSQTKNGKPHATHLSPPALDAIASIQENGDNLVFSTTGRTPVSGISKMKKRLDEILGEDFEPWRLHDIRTAMATTLAEAGEPENIVDRILNHSASGSAPSAVARVYNQAEQLPQRAKALDKWAEMVTGEATKIVRFRSDLS
jgi:integrase